jgi:hypothetical protein
MMRSQTLRRQDTIPWSRIKAVKGESGELEDGFRADFSPVCDRIQAIGKRLWAGDLTADAHRTRLTAFLDEPHSRIPKWPSSHRELRCTHPRQREG